MLQTSLRALFSSLVVLGATLGVAPRLAADTPPVSLPEIQEPVQHLLTAIDGLERTVDQIKTSEEDLARQRIEIEGLIEGTQLVWDNLWPQLGAIRGQIEKLGNPPGKDDPPEAQQIAAERQRLNSIAAEIHGAMKSTELVQVRAHQLQTHVQELRQGIFTGELLRRTQSPLSPTTWRQVAGELPTAVRQIGEVVIGVLKLPHDKLLGLLGVLAAAFAVYLGIVACVRRFVRRRLSREGDSEPTFFERAATAGWVAPALALPAALSLLLLGAGLDGAGLLDGDAEALWGTFLQAAGMFVAVWALGRAILQPARTRWRLVDLSDTAAAKLQRILTRIAAVYAIDLVLKELIRILSLPLSISIVETFAASIAIAVLLLELVRLPFEPHPRIAPDAIAAVAAEGPAPPLPAVSRLYPHSLKLVLLAAAIAIIAASLLGYISLGRFIAGQVVVTGSVIALVLLIHLAIKALMGAPGSGIKPLSTVLSEQAGLEEAQSGALTRAMTALLDVGLALLAIPLVLLTWGYSLPEALSWLKSAIFGFEVGQFKISFARILLAIVLFLALLFLTRLAQRWLNSGLKQSRFDEGIANSIHTAVGYAGFAVAVLVAVSYGGLDITNFAIVAGALSVGIGFGLQSIVNNFVSGLILLAERPVKVGDLVAINGQEGRVRRIAVRSTEIETGDKASLIVPNSEFITSAVTNWTHRNALGRVVIRVGASFRSDPEHVREVLQRVARECPLILQQPAPGFSFDNFGPNGFEFSVSAVVADVGRLGAAQTDLRMRIVKAFRAEGIEMPYAQHDVHLRDLDAVKILLSRMAEERARERAHSAAATAKDAPIISGDDPMEKKRT